MPYSFTDNSTLWLQDTRFATLKPDMTDDKQTSRTTDNFFLPDFCSVQMVFAVVIISELLAILLTLAPLKSSGDRWNDLSIISLFVQWVALASAGLLCAGRRGAVAAERRLAASG